MPRGESEFAVHRSYGSVRASVVGSPTPDSSRSEAAWLARPSPGLHAEDYLDKVMGSCGPYVKDQPIRWLTWMGKRFENKSGVKKVCRISGPPSCCVWPGRQRGGGGGASGVDSLSLLIRICLHTVAFQPEVASGCLELSSIHRGVFTCLQPITIYLLSTPYRALRKAFSTSSVPGRRTSFSFFELSLRHSCWQRKGFFPSTLGMQGGPTVISAAWVGS